jgi:magnesium transporter
VWTKTLSIQYDNHVAFRKLFNAQRTVVSITGTSANEGPPLTPRLQMAPLPKKNKISLKCTEFDQQGNVKFTAGEYPKMELCAVHGLQPRELRTIDSSFKNLMPVILVRPQAIIVNLEHIKALIKCNSVLLFDSVGAIDNHHQSLFVFDMQERLRMTTQAAGGLTFEFRALEAMLISVFGTLQDEFMKLSPRITYLLKKLEEEPLEHEYLKQLLRASKKLTHFAARVNNVRQTLLELLNSDADMAAMYLTDKEQMGTPRPINQHEEIELLLENYLKQIDEIENETSEVLSNIKTTEDIINITLDSQRNRVMLLELKLTMGTLALGSGGVMSGIFGMNLLNHLEKHPHGFSMVVGSMTLVTGSLLWILLRRVQLLRRPL